MPSYQRTALSPAVLAFDGADAVTAAVNVSQAKWTDYRSAYKTAVPTADGAVLVPADAPPSVRDAAVLFAGARSIPVFPVSGNALDSRVTAELTRLFGQHDKHKAVVGYVGSTVPDAVASAVTAATGSAPLALGFHDAYDLGFGAEQAFLQQGQKNNGNDSSPAPLRPAQITLVVADDDRPGLLVALGVEQAYGGRSSYGGMSVRVVLTKGSTMPDAAKPILNAVKSEQVVAVGAHGAAALAGSWAGKPALKVTKFAGAAPAALADAALKGMPAVVKAAIDVSTSAPPTATVLPIPTDSAWTGELLVAAESGGPVLFSDSASALDSADLAYFQANLAALIHIDTFGDGTALAASLSKALNTPMPLPALADPKAPAPRGN